GVVSLSIGDNLAREIRSAASIISATGGSYTLTASIRGEYSDSQTVAVANGNYSGVTFTFEGVPVGKKIILDLTAKAGSNYIWYGNSGKHTVEQGENLLTIALGRVSGVLMWDSSSVKIAPYGNYEADSSIQNPKTPPVWCFDAQGNLYVLDANGGGMRYNLQADGTYPSANNATYSNSIDFSSLSYDNVTGILYGIGDSSDGLKLSSSPALGQGFNEMSWKPDNPDSLGGTILGMIVNDSVMYMISYDRTEEASLDGNSWKLIVTISKYDVNDGEDATLILKKTIPLPSVFDSTPDVSITGQMIYHEGALYLLLRSHGLIGWGSGYSIGAVVKINAQTLKIEKDFGQEGYLGLVPSSREFYGISCYAPTDSNDNAYFYGPMGFVAIMPKKLVIADSGYAMSAGNDLVNLSKRRRIVTVDLETESFSSVYDIDGNFYEPSSLAASGFQNVN
ncbi:MAG: hypothetical protein J6V57_08220, partial [Spirochaetaceae bacterium]|nr:hypothetical protein [Spirochaetaceae bacterium]